jgi:hypothetical protein
MAGSTTISIVAHSATPYSIMFEMSGDPGATSSLIPSTAMLIALHDGPLKAFLAKLPVANWADLNITGAKGNKIRIYEVGLTNADALEVRGGVVHVEWISNADPAQAGLLLGTVPYGAEGGTSVRTIEVRLNHSAQA